MLTVTSSESVAQEIPTDYSGGWKTITDRHDRLSLLFNKTIPTVNGHTSNLIAPLGLLQGRASVEFFRNQSIPGVVHGCPTGHTCKAKIRAPAFATTACVSHVIPVDYWAPLKDLMNIEHWTGYAPPMSTLSFMVDISMILGEDESINLITGYGTNHNCSGVFNYTICTLKSAIGEYEVSSGLCLVNSRQLS